MTHFRKEERLTEKQLRILLSLYNSGIEHTAICERFGISSVALNQYISRARKLALV